MYEFFGGVAKILVPDNASTAVSHRNYDWYSPDLIRSYGELAEHYNTAIIPARIRHPGINPCRRVGTERIDMDYGCPAQRTVLFPDGA